MIEFLLCAQEGPPSVGADQVEVKIPVRMQVLPRRHEQVSVRFGPNSEDCDTLKVLNVRYVDVNQGRQSRNHIEVWVESLFAESAYKVLERARLAPNLF